MKNLKVFLFLISTFVLFSCGKDEDPVTPITPTGNLTMSSELNADFRLEDAYTCKGTNVSPGFSWSDSYTNTQSYAVIASNGEAGSNRKIYWLLSNISNSIKKIDTNQTPSGAVVGKNSFGTSIYSGPCPNAGSGEQDFVIQLFALDKNISIEADASEAELLTAMEGSILKERSLTFFYSPFTISSNDFEHGETIPTIHTCDGSHQLPHLKWQSGNLNAVSYAIHMFDITANNFIHMLVSDIPGTQINNVLPQGAIKGTNNQDELGYFGPCPGANSASHLYYFQLYALDEKLNLPEGFSLLQFENAIAGHVVDRTDFYGKYPQ